jgi:hypothetical protein
MQFKNPRFCSLQFFKIVVETLEQGSQTSGPPNARQMPNAKKTFFLSNLAYFKGFSRVLRPAEAFFSCKLQPAKHFISRMWPSDQFEFETPALEHSVFKHVMEIFLLFL